ncbi:MAG: hypothetical protein K0U93_15405 [Gammaproteobacteria bacterium]|nr:hypothetical protein [Gammaproteobacteria bacterium]
MSLAKYCQLVSDFVRQGSAGWNAPRWSGWTVSGTGGATASIDVADVATLGTTVALPINLNVAAGTTELSLHHNAANLAFVIEGSGAGIGVGIGWALPATLAYGGSDALALPSAGIGSVLAGPKAHGAAIAPNDLVTNTAEPRGSPMLTIVSAAVGTQAQASLGIALFADRPVLEVIDLAYTKAIALIYGMQLKAGNAASADVTACVYSIRIRPGSLPSPGARYGMSIGT